MRGITRSMSNENSIPYIPPDTYDDVASEFLNRYCPETLDTPVAVPILDIARNKMCLDVQFVCLSEELDIYGATVFSDGMVTIYNKEDGVYEDKYFKRKTMLIDPEAYKKINSGCVNNTIAHECVHWYKHRYYHWYESIVLPRYANYCKCSIDELPESTKEENIMEAQAVGIAPRILMPKATFCEAARDCGIKYGENNFEVVDVLHELFEVSKQSVRIRLSECGLM